MYFSLFWNVIIALILLFSITDSFAQNDEIRYKSTFENENYALGSDSLLLIRHTERLESEFYESENVSSYLFHVRKKKVDTLIAIVQSMGDLQFAESKDQVDVYLESYFRPDEYAESIDSTVYQEYYSGNIHHIKTGVFLLSDTYWEYSGGAHGHGQSDYFNYDFYSKKYFEFEDVYKSEAAEAVYEITKKELTMDGLIYGFEEKKLDSLTQGNRMLPMYYFTENHFIIYCHAYEELYGVFYAGYMGMQIEIPYEKLKKYMLKESPIKRLMNENKRIE